MASPATSGLPDLIFEQRPRNRTTLITVLVIWTLLGLAWRMLDAAWWVIAIFALFTLPAIYDLLANPLARLQLTDTTLRWSAPRSEAEIALREIDHVRLDTRLDFSVRATAVLKVGPRLRLPYSVTPPQQAFEDALTARGIKVERHHFSLMQ